MPEETPDVNVDSSTTEEVEVKEQEEGEKIEQESDDTSEPQDVKPEVKVDRPEKNLFWETKRKVDDLYPLVNEIKEKLSTFQQPSEHKQQYSKAQLRAFAESTQDTGQKTWAYEEIEKIDKLERQTEMKQLFESHTKRTQEEQARTQATQFVAQNFPECFVKDANGNNVGWNNSSPLVRRIGEYMQNKALASNPEGLIAAAKMAAFDLGVSMNRKLQNKVNQTTAQLRKEQKKQLIAGVGSQGQQVEGKTKVNKLAEEYRKTGNKDVFKELAKARGLIPTEL